MEVAQVSIFLENRAGGLVEVIDELARHAVDIKALSLADMADFGILRLIVDDPEETRRLLGAAGFTVDKTQRGGGRGPRPARRPGRDAPRAAPRTASTSSTCTSAARRQGDRAIIIFRFDEIGRALDALRGAGVTVLDRLEPL